MGLTQLPGDTKPCFSTHVNDIIYQMNDFLYSYPLIPLLSLHNDDECVKQPDARFIIVGIYIYRQEQQSNH